MRGPALGIAAVVAALSCLLPADVSATSSLTGVDLSTYVRLGRFDLPLTPAPPNSQLAKEASAVTYDRVTDTLFLVGDEGTSVVQVDKTGHLIDSMTLAPGEFEDTEGITWVGGNQFVVTEERVRQANLFTYVPGGVLHKTDAQTVKLGTTVGNIGIEGISFDPSSGFIVVKEIDPEGVFQAGIDFSAGTATNGSPTTENSANLFDPALAGLPDFSDVFALSNLTSLTGADTSHLLILSQEAGKIVSVDRSGAVSSSLTIVSDPGNPLSVPDQGHEGLTMDDDGNLYVVSENGAGLGQPQLWVYQHSTAANTAPTAVVLNNQVTSIAENTSTVTRLKVADVSVTDDGLGTDNLTVTGPDAASFEVESTGLYIKVGTMLDFETKASYSVTVAVDDPSVGAAPDATAPFSLAVTDVVNENPSQPIVFISEVSPWSSGNSPYAADWFEVTNAGTSAVSIAGWKMDDDSNAFGSAVALNGVDSIPAGQSAVFIEGTAATATAFKTAWFAANVPIGFAIGTYSGGGVGLGAGGDAVNLFDALGNRVTGVRFGASTTGFTFDNAAGVGGSTLPLPLISTLSVAGRNGAFLASDGVETGSPGTTRQVPIITEVSPWSSGNTPYAADWFEVTNTGTRAVDITGWKMDDNSNAFGSAVALTGVTSIGPGKSVIFIEGNAATAVAFQSAWFGGDLPSGFTIGTYSGGGVGLSTTSDAVNLFDALGNRVTGVAFGASTTGFTFDNTAGLGSTTLPLPIISTLSVAGVHGAFVAAGGVETGSPLPEADTTAPAIVASPVPGSNASGWNNTDVTVSYSCTDGGSGVDPLTSSLGADVLTASGTASGTCVDRAGNSASASYSAQIDKAPPAIAATGTPTPNANGWNDSDITVSYGCTDDGSGIDTAASSISDDVLTASGAATGTCVDRAGNSAGASYTAQIDRAAPTVGYTGNAGAYGLLDTVAITCAAADALSGLGSSSCPDANGAAWTFGAGPHTLSAAATDRAGNAGSASATFTVTVKPVALCTLTRQFVQGSARYQALRPLQKAIVDVLVSVACNVVLDLAPVAPPAQKARLVASYKQAVQGLVQPGWLTAGQASTLGALANAI